MPTNINFEKGQIVQGMSFEEYVAVDACNKSTLDDIKKKCPEYARYYQVNPKPDTPAKRFGHAFHILTLEAHRFKEAVAIMPESWPTKKECGVTQAEQKEAFEKDNAHKKIISHNDHELARAMATSIKNHKGAMHWLAMPGQAEVSMFWQNTEILEGFPLRCKARIDKLCDNGIMIDIKTTESAATNDFARSVDNYGYRMQIAQYYEGYKAIFGSYPRQFVIIAVEKDAPHLVSTYKIATEDLALGQEDLAVQKLIYAKCKKEDKWPGYGDEPLPLPRTSYTQRRMDYGQDAAE